MCSSNLHLLGTVINLSNYKKRVYNFSMCPFYRDDILSPPLSNQIELYYSIGMNYKLCAKYIEEFILDKRLKSKKLADGGGLHLLVTNTGKCWRYNYRINHKQKTLALGTYPEVSMRAARQAQSTRTSVIT